MNINSSTVSHGLVPQPWHAVTTYKLCFKPLSKVWCDLRIKLQCPQ